LNFDNTELKRSYKIIFSVPKRHRRAVVCLVTFSSLILTCKKAARKHKVWGGLERHLLATMVRFGCLRPFSDAIVVDSCISIGENPTEQRDICSLTLSCE